MYEENMMIKKLYAHGKVSVSCECPEEAEEELEEIIKNHVIVTVKVSQKSLAEEMVRRGFSENDIQHCFDTLHVSDDVYLRPDSRF